MKAQGVTCATLGAAVGVTADAISKWRRGHDTPRFTHMVDAAEFLMSPRLLKMAQHVHAASCRACGREFIKAAPQHLYCSPRCHGLFHQRRRLGRKADISKLRLRRLPIYEEAVDGVCRQWCPNDGYCPDATCPVQKLGLSPLPLAVERVA